MEYMGVLGFIFGLSGLSYAVKSKNDIDELKKEFESFKASKNQ
mgnify:CR=1 FL=1